MHANAVIILIWIVINCEINISSCTQALCYGELSALSVSPP